jgi:hypothetical protein
MKEALLNLAVANEKAVGKQQKERNVIEFILQRSNIKTVKDVIKKCEQYERKNRPIASLKTEIQIVFGY